VAAVTAASSAAGPSEGGALAVEARSLYRFFRAGEEDASGPVEATSTA
jgi:hypothetical protein